MKDKGHNLVMDLNKIFSKKTLNQVKYFLSMNSGTIIIYPHELNKELSLKFTENDQLCKTPEEGWRVPFFFFFG